jgi:hypothetical protein
MAWYLGCFFFYINGLTHFDTMYGLESMAWYFIEALIFRATIP